MTMTMTTTTTTTTAPVTRMPYREYVSTVNIFQHPEWHECCESGDKKERELRSREEKLRVYEEACQRRMQDPTAWQTQLLSTTAEELNRREAEVLRREAIMRQSEAYVNRIDNAMRKEKELREWERRLATTENSLQRDQQRHAEQFNQRLRAERERVERDNEKHIQSLAEKLAKKRLKVQHKRREKERIKYGHEQVKKALTLAKQESAASVDARVQAEIDAQFALKCDELVAIELQRWLDEAQPPPQSLCVVCAEREITWMFKPCNHVATCAECTTLIFQSHKESNCPICKTVIAEIERVFLPH